MSSDPVRIIAIGSCSVLRYSLDFLGASHLCVSLQGAWRTIAERTQGFQSAGPHGSKEALEEAAWHVLALAKLRVHGAALEVLKTLGQLDAPEHSDTGQSLSTNALAPMDVLKEDQGRPDGLLQAATHGCISCCTY